MAQSSSEYVGAVKDTVTSFWHGMSITLSHLFRRPITVQYPDRTELPVRDQLPPRYRGLLEVDAAICTGCQACERACPIGCIQITLEKDPANPKQRAVSQFDIDEAKCMYCGLCVEQCPTGSLQHTREFEASQRSVRNLVFRWADPMKPFPVYKVQKGAEYFPRAPLGSLVRALMEARAWDAPGVVYLPPEPPKPPAPAKSPAAAKPPAPAKPAAIPAPAKPAPAAPGTLDPVAKPADLVAAAAISPGADGAGAATASAATTAAAAAPSAVTAPKPKPTSETKV